MLGLSDLRITRCFAIQLIGALLLAGTARAESCELARLTELPLEGNDIGSPVVKILVDDQPRRMLLDTGGFWSLLDPAVTGGYRPEKAPISGLLGLKGIVLDKVVRVPSIQFGIVRFRNTEFYVAPSDYVGVDGTLGANWLQGFDVEIDPVKNTVSMFAKNHCEGSIIYWPHQDSAELPIEIDNRDKRITVPLELNGHEIQALIDTGTSETVLNLRTAKSLFDLTPESPGMQEVASRTDRHGTTQAAYRFQFKSLTMGDIGFANPWVVLAPMSGEGPDMILGMHHLHGLHLYFAYGQRKLYVTTGRGDIAAQQAAGGQVQASAATVPPPQGPDPMARVNAKDFLAEAMIALKKGDKAAAATAIDKAVHMDPSYPDVYLARAGLRFEQGDRTQATTDMAEALARAPDDPDVLSERAAIYAGAGEYDLAYADVDKALQINSKSLKALNGRCRFGAHIGKYEAALADCDAALALDPRSPSTLDSRAYVYLKMARPDLAIAEYDKALKSNRNSASAYYGRALAEQQKGEKSDSEDDMAMARKIDPDIEKDFGR
jgi:Tfp pilus assembly protein PilF